MKPLFYSLVCDHCDGKEPSTDATTCDRGYVVLRGRPMPTEEHVFSSRADAERWRDAQGLTGCPIVTVLAPVKFRWRKSTGAVKGLEMADRLVTIYPDRRFAPAPNRAYVAATAA